MDIEPNEKSPMQLLKERRAPKRKKVTSKIINPGMGDRLREWRKAANLNLSQLAKKLGLGITTLSEIETNKSLPSADTLARLYKKTNLDIFWLLFKEGDMLQENTPEEVVRAIRQAQEKKVPKQTIFNMKLPAKKTVSI